MTKVYELEEGERIVALTQYHDEMLVATTHRLFRMWEEWDGFTVGSKKVHRIEPILLAKGESDDD